MYICTSICKYKTKQKNFTVKLDILFNKNYALLQVYDEFFLSWKTLLCTILFLLLYYVVFYAQVVNVKVYSQLQVVKRILQYTKYFSAVFSDPFWPPGSGSNSYGWIQISQFSVWIHCLIWIPLEPSPPNSCQAHGHIRIRPDPLDWDVYEAHGNGQIRFLS